MKMGLGLWNKRRYTSVDLTKAFAEGYEQGYKMGRQDAIWTKINPNLLRELLGLQPIDKHIIKE